MGQPKATIPLQVEGLRTAMSEADPAGLMAAEAVEAAVGRVQRGLQRVYNARSCGVCGGSLYPKSSAVAHVLTVSGLVELQHEARVCKTRRCQRLGRLVWANFVSDARGNHSWCVGSACEDIAMLSPRFGVTWSWHQQFSRRLLHQHSTFGGESEVHSMQDHGLGKGKLLVAQAWMKLRLLERWPTVGDGAFPLHEDFADIYDSVAERHAALMAARRCKLAREPSVCVVDGNQKLTRRTCAEIMVGTKHIAGTSLLHHVDCGNTPSFRSCFCKQHLLIKPSADPGMVITRKLCVAACESDLVRLTQDGKPVAAPDLAAVRSALHQASIKAHKRRRGEHDVEVSDTADAVECRTHKMRRRLNRRSGGWLVACSGDGMVLQAEEFLGGESLTQRAGFVAQCLHEYPSIQTVVHDDACHLQAFMSKWLCKHPKLCYPSLRFVIDKFHARGHVDPWCRQHCHPDAPGNAERLQLVNTSACELLFAWLSGYKGAFRHMRKQTAQFFILELLDMRNEWQAARKEKVQGREFRILAASCMCSSRHAHTHTRAHADILCRQFGRTDAGTLALSLSLAVSRSLFEVSHSGANSQCHCHSQDSQEDLNIAHVVLSCSCTLSVLPLPFYSNSLSLSSVMLWPSLEPRLEIQLSETCSHPPRSRAMDAMRMEAAWKVVEEKFDAQSMFGPSGAEFIEYIGAKTCLHPLAVGVPVLAALAPLTNGAAITLWSDPSPLAVVAVLVNPPQSRKSQATALVREMGMLDDFVLKQTQEAFASMQEQRGQEPEHVARDLSVASCVLEGFTPEAFFEAVSGDYPRASALVSISSEGRAVVQLLKVRWGART